MRCLFYGEEILFSLSSDAFQYYNKTYLNLQEKKSPDTVCLKGFRREIDI